MNVLIACERSGRVRDAFAARGHNAWSCDLVESESPGHHIIGDALQVIEWGCWDLLVGHPPCRTLSYAGMAHWNKPGRAEEREAAMAFFMALVNAPIPKIAIENPRGLPHQAYRKPDQVIHPYMFGDPFMKRTSLWLKGLPKLWWWDKPGSFFEITATDIPAPASIDRSGKKRYFVDSLTRDPVDRARTFPSVAAAMAAQWG